MVAKAAASKKCSIEKIASAAAISAGENRIKDSIGCVARKVFLYVIAPSININRPAEQQAVTRRWFNADLEGHRVVLLIMLSCSQYHLYCTLEVDYTDRSN